MRRPALTMLLVSCLLASLAPITAVADVSGQWYGVGWDADNAFQSTNIDLHMTESAGSGVAMIHVPEFGLFHQSLPLTVDGDDLVIGNPGVVGFIGVIDGETISGEAFQAFTLVGTWSIEREFEQPPMSGPAPGPACDDLPPMMCDEGGILDCSELIQFEPSEGWGYLDYPLGGETWDDQRYSFVRRDLAQLIMYATAKVACKTADWDYGNFAPLGLGDGSEDDGATPGTDIGSPRHPPGTHLFGLDIDTAYYQIYAPDDLLRPIGEHYDGDQDQFHLLQEPFLLDLWRNALFIAYLCEHPRLRVIGVDGVVGPMLDDALDQLVTLGWIDANLRQSVSLAYEVEDGGLGWYLFHHTHMHISFWFDMTETRDDGATPVARLQDCYPNPFNPRTTIGFEVDRRSAVRLDVVDLRGRLVTTLVNEVLEAGRQAVEWNGRDSAGRDMPSGVYVSRLEAAGRVAHGRMTLVR